MRASNGGGGVLLRVCARSKICGAPDSYRRIRRMIYRGNKTSWYTRIIIIAGGTSESLSFLTWRKVVGFADNDYGDDGAKRLKRRRDDCILHTMTTINNARDLCTAAHKYLTTTCT